MAPKLLFAVGCQAVAAQIVRGAGNVLQAPAPRHDSGRGTGRRSSAADQSAMRRAACCARWPAAAAGGRRSVPWLRKSSISLARSRAEMRSPECGAKMVAFVPIAYGCAAECACLAPAFKCMASVGLSLPAGGRQRPRAHPVQVVNLWVPGPLRIPDPCCVLFRVQGGKLVYACVGQAADRKAGIDARAGRRRGAPCTGQSVRRDAASMTVASTP